MDDLISRAWLLAEYDKRHKGPPGGARKLIEEAPSALSTNLAEVGTGLISRAEAIDDIWTVSPLARLDRKWVDRWLRQLPSAQPDIIYCVECTKMKVDSVFHDCWCSETGKKVWINHYCGYAERREVTE